MMMMMMMISVHLFMFTFECVWWRFAETEQSEDGLHQMLKERDKHIVELEYCLTSANEEKAHAFQKQRFVLDYNIMQNLS